MVNPCYCLHELPLRITSARPTSLPKHNKSKANSTILEVAWVQRHTFLTNKGTLHPTSDAQTQFTITITITITHKHAESNRQTI